MGGTSSLYFARFSSDTFDRFHNKVPGSVTWDFCAIGHQTMVKVSNITSYSVRSSLPMRGLHSSILKPFIWLKVHILFPGDGLISCAPRLASIMLRATRHSWKLFNLPTSEADHPCMKCLLLLESTTESFFGFFGCKCNFHCNQHHHTQSRTLSYVWCVWTGVQWCINESRHRGKCVLVRSTRFSM